MKKRETNVSNKQPAGLPQYTVYRFNLQDWLTYLVKVVGKAILICFLFYDSYKAILVFIPFSIVEYKKMKKEKIQKRLRTLTLQFKEMIESLVTSLNVGYSLEKAMAETRRDLALIYDESAVIFPELDSILSGLKMNIPIETLLKSFGERSGIDDIRNFGNVVTVAKRNGGNLIRIIQKTVNSISDKIAVEEEIETLIAAKKYEAKIMLLMPYGILLYLRISNGGFFDVLYHNVLGVFIMTTFLILIYVAEAWAGKIMEIRV